MSIKKLPNYIINKLKAGEIVERPSSVIKEIIENSIDSGATEIFVNLENGGTTLMQVQDNGCGISMDDAPLVLERYATSKIESENDLQTLGSYGFRGEALASIGEVSKLTIQTKTKKDKIGTRIFKQNQEINIENIATSFYSGTNILIQNLFFNTPARLKFLKTPNTEYKYCQKVFFNFVLINPKIQRTLVHNGKTIFKNDSLLQDNISDKKTSNGLKEIIAQIYKKDWNNNLHNIFYSSSDLNIYGVISDSVLQFPTPNQIKVFVNKRPIEDKIVKKAILQAYHNQIAPRQYPIAYIFLNIKPSLVDVNVHPRKNEVKFLDTQMIYGTVLSTVSKSLSNMKILNTNKFGETFHSKETKPYGFKTAKRYFFDKKERMGVGTINNKQTRDYVQQKVLSQPNNNIQTQSVFDEINETIGNNGKDAFFPQEVDNVDTEKHLEQSDKLNIKIIGQLWNLYIIAELEDKLLYIDQHALAERIAFEKIQKIGFGKSTDLLTPVNISIPTNIDIDNKVGQLSTFGFECSLLSETSLVIYSVPEVFIKFTIDFEKVFEKVLFMDKIDFNSILDKVFSTKACRTSIKAGDKLSTIQMQQLISDAFEHIPGSFVCPHGRPFFVQIDRQNIDGMFDR